MSDRLAIAAALSVLTMSIYVLFGADAARAPVSDEGLASKLAIPAPKVSIDAGELLR